MPDRGIGIIGKNESVSVNLWCEITDTMKMVTM